MKTYRVTLEVDVPDDNFNQLHKDVTDRETTVESSIEDQITNLQGWHIGRVLVATEKPGGKQCQSH